MSWSNDQVAILIEEYEKYPALYKVKHADYHNKHRRNLCLQKIVSELETIRPKTTGADIHKKFTGLRSTYACERRKYVDSLKSGAGEDDVYKPSLWYYDKIQFLNAHLGIRKSKTNMYVDTGSAAEEAAYSAEGEDVSSAAEQNEEVLEVYEMSENEVIFSPTASTSAMESPIPRKRRCKQQNTETLESATSACLQDISVAMQTYITNKTSTDAPDDDAAYALYMHARLARLKNQRRKLRVKHVMDVLQRRWNRTVE